MIKLLESLMKSKVDFVICGGDFDFIYYGMMIYDAKSGLSIIKPLAEILSFDFPYFFCSWHIS